MSKLKKDILWRVYLSFFLIVIVALLIFGQAASIQIFEGKKWIGLADSLTTDYKTMQAERGNIFSEDGKLLATSLPFFEIRLDLATPALTDEVFYEQIDSLAWHLANHFRDKSKQQYKSDLIWARKQMKRYYLLKRNVTFPTLQEMKTWPLLKRGRYKGGLIVVQKNRREKPFGILAHRTIGYVRTGRGAKSVGLEQQFNDQLKGRDGKRLMQKIAGGNWVPINDDNEIEPVNGSDLITTIDINMQDLAENALLKTLIKNNAHHGSVILMEVKTGKIKAMANLGRKGPGSYFENYNYAIGEATEPGSTFKLATMLSLLEDKHVKLTDSVDIGYGEVWFHGRKMSDATLHNRGMVTVARAFELSSNVGITKLAYRYYAKEPGRFVQHLHDFRLDEPVGIELKGEAKPLIKSTGDPGWSKISIPWMSVGYELMLAPIQILNLYNTIANDGRMMKPYLISAIREYGKTKQFFQPEVIDDKICSDETIKQVQKLLEGVVENGTAKSLKSKDYKIAGKTGTAKIAEGKSGYAKKVYQASFVGYFPADNPQYSCIVVVNAPSNGVYYGSSVAGPVFKEIADKIYATKIQLELEMEDNQIADANGDLYSIKGNTEDFLALQKGLNIKTDAKDLSEWIICKTEGDQMVVNNLKIEENKVPNVRGMGLKDALFLLENHGLEVLVSGKGKVKRQSLTPGTIIKKGMQITIELS
jgi:cell division protein FtsI (penicillin-binding protein 3)